MNDPLDVDGPAAPPRENGELVFTAPWQARVFGTTLALHQARAFAWDEFRLRLMHHIAHDDGAAYYDSFAAALVDVLAAKNLVTNAELDERLRFLALRPAGHDHRHEHDHDHDHDHDVDPRLRAPRRSGS